MNDAVLALTERIDRTAPITRLAAVAGSLFTVVVLDVVTGPDLSLSLAYALCAMAAAWSLSARFGVVVAVAAAAAAFIVDLVTGPDRATSVVVLNHAFGLASFVLLASLAAAVRNSLSELLMTSRIDPMTGVLNRHGFLQELARVRRRAERTGEPIAVVYFDLDGLKLVNDREGHAAGDALLRRFADRVVRHLRATDPFGRLGGDEFAVAIERAEPEALDLVVRRILDDPGLPSTSCGVQVFHGSYPPPSTMLAGADRRMYRDKQGRSHFGRRAT